MNDPQGADGTVHGSTQVIAAEPDSSNIATLGAPKANSTSLPFSFLALCLLYLICAVAEVIAPTQPFDLSFGMLLALLWQTPSSPKAMAILLPVLMGGLLPETIAETARNVSNPCLPLAILVGAVALRHLCTKDDPISSLAGLGRFTVIAVIVAFVSTTAGALTGFVAPFGFASWLRTLSRESLDLLLVTPITLILSVNPSARREAPRSRMDLVEAVSILTLAVGATVAALSIGWPLLAFLLIPPMLLATLRFGQTGAAVVAAITVLTIMLAFGVGVETRATMLRFDLATLFLTSLVAATQLREHRGLVARLRQSEARYRVLAEGSGDAVLFVDADWRCWFASPSIERLLGYSPEIMKRHLVGSCVHQDEIAGLREAGRRALSSPNLSQRVELRIRRRSGEWSWVETRIAAIEGASRGATLACAIRDINEQRERELALEHRANTDALTGILNRESFIHSLKDALTLAARDNQPLVLVALDVDNFKVINDRHGHPAGDRVLHMIGKVISSVIRSIDSAGRVGGDEFSLALRNADVGIATEICRRLRDALAIENSCGDRFGSILPSISMGLAPYSSGTSADMLIALADQTLYAAKASGRNRAFVSVDGILTRLL